MKKNSIHGYLLIMPAVLLLTSLLIYPFARTVVSSFYNETTIQFEPTRFIGLRNFISVWSDPFFVNALVWTVQFTIITVVISIIFAMAFALIMKRKFKGQSLIRVIILMPWAIPAIIAGLVWSDIFGYNGFINSALVAVRFIKEKIIFFNNPDTAKLAIIIADVWKSTPYSALLLLAGLLGIPKECYEAAEVDGASRLRQFTNITIPLLLPTIAVVVMFRLISAFRSYGLVIAMTGGGPGGTTETIAMYAVKAFFTFGKTSYGATISIIMMIISLLFSLLFIKTLRGKGEVS